MATLNIKGVPDSLYRRLQARAKKEHRSVAQEVVHILSQATDQLPTLSILELEGLGKELWKGKDAARHVSKERRSWD
jgi:plasmid stability protein